MVGWCGLQRLTGGGGLPLQKLINFDPFVNYHVVIFLSLTKVKDIIVKIKEIKWRWAGHRGRLTDDLLIVKINLLIVKINRMAIPHRQEKERTTNMSCSWSIFLR